MKSFHFRQKKNATLINLPKHIPSNTADSKIRWASLAHKLINYRKIENIFTFITPHILFSASKSYYKVKAGILAIMEVRYDSTSKYRYETYRINQSEARYILIYAC